MDGAPRPQAGQQPDVNLPHTGRNRPSADTGLAGTIRVGTTGAGGRVAGCGRLRGSARLPGRWCGHAVMRPRPVQEQIDDRPGYSPSRCRWPRQGRQERWQETGAAPRTAPTGGAEPPMRPCRRRIPTRACGKASARQGVAARAAHAGGPIRGAAAGALVAQSRAGNTGARRSRKARRPSAKAGRSINSPCRLRS